MKPIGMLHSLLKLSRYASISVLTVFVLSACTSTSKFDAPISYLTPHGWLHLNDQLQAPSFNDYKARVAQDVLNDRVPFDTTQVAKEARMASPIEVPPASSCNGQQRGIALLVHGLSDTAFAMQDFAIMLAKSCMRARTVLLPGHGTRSGDLLSVRLHHWTRTLDYLIEQAASEDDRLLVVGFSLGAVLTLKAAVKPNSPVDAIIAVSPAYSLSTWKLARLAPWFHRLKPWIDREPPDDSMRYEAMPTRGVAETVKAIKAMRNSVSRHGPIDRPWLLIQSTDDLVTVPSKNAAFLIKHATNPISRVIEFAKAETFNDPIPDYSDHERIGRYPGFKEESRVLGLTHTSVHISPGNSHYGIEGEYRNCGGTGPRDKVAVDRCTSAEEVWYGLWGQEVEAGRAQAMSTFNPSFDLLEVETRRFIEAALPQ